MSTAGRTLRLALIFSIGLNVAFVGVWAAKTLPERLTRVRPAPAGGGGSHIWCPLYRELGVDSVQWGQIEPRLRQFQLAVAAKRTETAKLRAQMLEMLASDSPDTQKVRAKQVEILACQGQMQVMVVSHLLAEKQLLTPEQRSKLFQMMHSCCQCSQSGAALDGTEPTNCAGKSGDGVGSR